jgi:hypothetical protein
MKIKESKAFFQNKPPKLSQTVWSRGIWSYIKTGNFCGPFGRSPKVIKICFKKNKELQSIR